MLAQFSSSLRFARWTQRQGSLKRRVQIGHTLEIGKFSAIIGSQFCRLGFYDAILSARGNNGKLSARIEPGQFGMQRSYRPSRGKLYSVFAWLFITCARACKCA